MVNGINKQNDPGASEPEMRLIDKWPHSWYDSGCGDCLRLHHFRKTVKAVYPDYFCRPVPPFGDPHAGLLIVGLAPGMHGANATGRPFTGDDAGRLLYRTLHKFGFSNAPISKNVGDGLELTDCRITNAVKCLPPQNKPGGGEEKQCSHFLASELREPNLKVILALGLLAHRAVLRSFGVRLNKYKFAHNRIHELDNGLSLINSYHCSRYNTRTRRLTTEMFERVFDNIQSRLCLYNGFRTK